MILILSGLIIGAVMGLTGAGGAIIAIPLFMQFLSLSLKEASVLSLVAAALASLLNLLSQRRHVDLPLALSLFLPSVLGSYVSALFKASLPELVMKVLLGGISLYAFYAVWFPSREEGGQGHAGLFLGAGVGLILGVLTTLTGLGGGVLLLPVLLSVFGLPHQRAVATSLVAVSLTSLTSLLIQMLRGAEAAAVEQISYLAAGILISALSLGYLLKRVSPSLTQRISRIVFSLVVIIALVKIFGPS